MKDVNFASLKALMTSTPSYVIEDMGFADEEAFFAAANDRAAILKQFFSEVYFLEQEDEIISYYGSDGQKHGFQFKPIQLPFDEEEFIKIRDNVYDRGGDPNKIVLGVQELFCKPDYSDYKDKSRTDFIKASYFVKY